MTTIALVPLARAAADCGVQRAHSRAAIQVLPIVPRVM